LDSLYKSVMKELKVNDNIQYCKYETLAGLLSDKGVDEATSKRRETDVVKAFATVAGVRDYETAKKNWLMIRLIKQGRNSDQHDEQWQQQDALEVVNEFFKICKIWKAPGGKKYFFQNYEKMALKDILDRVVRKNYYHMSK